MRMRIDVVVSENVQREIETAIKALGRKQTVRQFIAEFANFGLRETLSEYIEELVTFEGDD